MLRSTEDLRIRGLRPSRLQPQLDPFAPPRVLLERERRRGLLEQSLTVFLTGAECPFTCVFCDLWRHTLEGPTPPGALPAQLGLALDAPEADPGSCDRIKLYNASNWFDPRAVPRSEFDQLGRLVAPFRAVTVESHARMVGPRCQAFADRIDGRLEVAIGLETVHPGVLSRLNKGMTLDDFERAAAWLGDHDMDLRVFALVGAPFIPPEESVPWAVRTAEYALDRGAAIVSLIPVRPGPGELARLAEAGEFTAPSLAQLEDALDCCLRRGMDGVTADLWDADQLVACPACRPAGLGRLDVMNRTGVSPPTLPCLICRGGP